MRRNMKVQWLAAAALAVFAPTYARAQDGSDAAVEALIKDLDADKEKKADAKKPDAPKQDDAKKPEAKPSDKPRGQAPADKPKPKPAELTGKDKELDDLLQSLGETKDKPDTQDERKRPGAPDMDQDKDKNQDAGQGDKNQDQDQKNQGGQGQGRNRQPRLTDKDKAIDEELEELAGRPRKRNRDDGDGQASGPMGEMIKEMREVEKRLSEPDTGEETRGRQQQLVKQMEKLIEQIRQQQQQGGQGMAQGQQGEQQGDQEGNNPGGAPNQRLKNPTDKHSLAKGKDQWGHLPPEQRQEMENINKEEALPTLEGLIRRYYVSVSRGKLNRGE
ncbi:hypothetical protein [Paludisphaera rhizosphaerae]|uniref:hypothetical protein n=1 Tax=Paludisphaera rhizosphaerae TaxID=2711216 RepID=UPI0013EA4431|nr:hypothetical protein [Paludisphaera rhizosphaerae]